MYQDNSMLYTVGIRKPDPENRTIPHLNDFCRSVFEWFRIRTFEIHYIQLFAVCNMVSLNPVSLTLTTILCIYI